MKQILIIAGSDTLAQMVSHLVNSRLGHGAHQLREGERHQVVYK